jgi:MFS transporter, OFA family, oxalate/formate antiporter
MKNKTFYGWYMLAGMTLMYTATNGIAMYAFGVLRKIQAAQSPELGLDPSTQAALPALLFMVVALVSPIVGSLLDRYSPKLIISIGAILAVALTFSHQFVGSYTGLRVVYAFFAIAMSFAGIISFMFLINRWFKKNIGLAAGILLVGSSLGSLIFPKIVVAAGDWRLACNWLGFAAAAFLIAPLLLIKNTPEEMDETQDGLPNSKLKIKNEELKTVPKGVYSEGSQNFLNDGLIASQSMPSENLEGLTLGEAVRSASFYLVLVVTGALWFCINGYIQNHSFFMTDLGKTAGEAAAVIGTFGMTAIVGKLLFGWLSDKFERRLIMVGSIGLLLISIFILKMCQTNSGLLMPFAVVFGIGFGGAFSMIQIWVADIYAGKNFGSILGVVTMVDTIAGSAGMITLGNMRKSMNTYDGGFNVMLVLCAVALVATLLVKKPLKA